MGFLFLHAADLHLDSPFTCLSRDFPQELSEALIGAQFDALERLIDLAIASDCTFLCLAGDIFDTGEFSLSAKMRFLDKVARLKQHNIKTFMVLGNHDPLGPTGSPPLPSNQEKDGIHVFTQELETCSIKAKDGTECLVSGISFRRKKESRNLALLFRAIQGPADAISIGLLHTNCGRISGHGDYAPCTISDLALSPVDYWALGHVHTYRCLREADPVIAYPGVIQARHFGEKGPKGAILVKVEDGPHFKPVFVELDTIRWEDIEIRAGGYRSLDELNDHILSAISKTTRENPAPFSAAYPTKFRLLRVILIGKAKLKKMLFRLDFLNDLKESLNIKLFEDHGIWIDEILDLTSHDENRHGSWTANDLAHEIIETTKKFKNDQALREILSREIDALFRKRELARLLHMPDEVELDHLISEAGDLILELLEDDSVTR